jgi:hypothetical protein
MKHEGKLEGREWLARPTRIGTRYDVLVESESGRTDAEVLNVSSAGFRLHSRDPLQAGWEVILNAPRQEPVRAVIRWANGLEAGGVFTEAVAL